MGCAASRRKKAAYNRLRQYQQTSLAASQGLLHKPVPLDPEEPLEGIITLKLFHNFFFEGFYSAYIRNPHYLLLVDVRGEQEWRRKRIIGSKPAERISFDHSSDIDKLRSYSRIYLYDWDGSGLKELGAFESNQPLAILYKKFKELKIESASIIGGFRTLEQAFPYLVSSEPLGGFDSWLHQERVSLPWYPSALLDRNLFLGRAEQASDLRVINSIGITHLIAVRSDERDKHLTILPKTTPHGSQLQMMTVTMSPAATPTKNQHQSSSNGCKATCPITSFSVSFEHRQKRSEEEREREENRAGDNDEDNGEGEGEGEQNGVGLERATMQGVINETTRFIRACFRGGGKVLVYGEHGANRSASVVIGFVMQEKMCTLEDAYDYVKTLRPGVQVSQDIFEHLIAFEVSLFGKRLSYADELWY